MHHELSIVLLSFNQEKYIADGLNSLLSQSHETLEIVIVDDSSTDETFEILNKITQSYSGAKSIKLLRNATNLGVVGNLSIGLQHSTGDLIFIAGGDDISAKDRCAKSYEFWLNAGGVHDLLATDGYDMGLDGRSHGLKNTDNLQEWDLSRWHTDQRPYFFGASFMISRRLAMLSPLDPKLPFEDQVYVHRALLMNGAIRLPKPLVHHRRGGISQPIKKPKLQRKKSRLLKSSAANLIEIEQFLRDAEALGRREDIEKFVSEKWLVESFAKSLLEKRRFSEKIKTFLSEQDLSARKKIRYLKYALSYPD
jgi:glycosyltransferase involved in cell wall biosynthesis